MAEFKMGTGNIILDVFREVMVEWEFNETDVPTTFQIYSPLLNYAGFKTDTSKCNEGDIVLSTKLRYTEDFFKKHYDFVKIGYYSSDSLEYSSDIMILRNVINYDAKFKDAPSQFKESSISEFGVDRFNPSFALSIYFSAWCMLPIVAGVNDKLEKKIIAFIDSWRRALHYICIANISSKEMTRLIGILTRKDNHDDAIGVIAELYSILHKEAYVNSFSGVWDAKMNTSYGTAK